MAAVAAQSFAVERSLQRFVGSEPETFKEPGETVDWALRRNLFHAAQRQRYVPTTFHSSLMRINAGGSYITEACNTRKTNPDDQRRRTRHEFPGALFHD